MFLKKRFPAQQAIEFTPNGVKKATGAAATTTEHPLSGSSVSENALLMRKVRGE